MAARKWTTEQKARQAALIRTWAPWAASTGPKTAQGKKMSSRNAVNYSCREVGRELVRTNRALLAYLNGATTTAPTYDRTTIDKLLDGVEQAVNAPATARKAKTKAQVASASKKPLTEPVATAKRAAELEA